MTARDEAREELRRIIVDAQADWHPDSGREMAEDVLGAVAARPELVALAAGAEVQREYGIPGKVWSGDGRRYPGDTHTRLVVTLPPTPLESEET